MTTTFPIQTNPKTYDVLVIGCGLAGITAAFRAADAGARVLLCAKTRLCSGSSFYSLMDTIHCQATIDEADEAVFMDDIRDCSARMNDSFMNLYYIQHIRDCIAYLDRIGIPFHKLPEPKLPCFGKHAHNLYFWTDWDSIRNSIYQHIEQDGRIDLAEHTDLISLIQDPADSSIRGACFYHKDQKKYEYTAASSVILATGGFGALYKHNLNSPDVSGDGQALALKAGASLINLEFDQFIPGFISPCYKIVFREGSLDYCEGLYNSENRNILREQFSDETQMNECLSQRAPHGPFTTADQSGDFDLALFQAALESPDNGVEIRYRKEILEDTRSYMVNYTQWLEDVFHIDIAKDPISIAPFFHAANGGIFVNHQCQSTIPGLFACGECAGGIHGADRLGGNASGSCLVFGTLAAQSAVTYVQNRMQEILPLTDDELQLQLRHTYRFEEENTNLASEAPDDILTRVKELMWRHANVLRSQESLDLAISQIRDLKEHYHPWQLLTSENCEKPEAIFQAEHFLTLAEAVLLAMSERKESRGGHYRSDFPTLNPEYEKRFAIRLQNGQTIAEPSPCMDQN